MIVSTQFLSYVHQCSRYCAIRFVVESLWCATNTRRRTRAHAHERIMRLSFAKVLLMFNQSIIKYITNIINSIICHWKIRVCACECVDYTLSFSLLIHIMSYMIAAIDAMPQLVIQLNCCCFSHTAEDA